MGACASTSRGRSNRWKIQKSAKIAAVPSTPPVQIAPAGASLETEEKRSFKWRIDGISSLLTREKGWTSSSYFQIKGLTWYLRLNLKDRKSGDEKEYVSLVLKLSKTSDLKPDTIVEAPFKLLIYDQVYGKHSEHEFSHNFQTGSARSSGVSCMIPIETFKKPSSGFIFDDTCVFGVELIKLSSTAASRAGFSAREAYTWDIDDFLALKKWCYSPEFQVGGHKWYLSMYPHGADKSGEFCSLYLHMCQPEASSLQGSELTVELTLSVKDQAAGKHTKLTGRCQFSAGAKGHGWGWAKFVALERLRDPANGYLVQGRCRIEADVAIVASSVE